jgi:probable rRNA maturation factor
MAGPRDKIAVEIARRFTGIEFDASGLRRLVRYVCRRFGVAGGTVSVAILPEQVIRRINRRFLGRGCSTDVISFDLSDDDSGVMFEILVNGQRAVGEARARGHSAEGELLLYVAHGLLHELGFDHRGCREARVMSRAQREILRELGYGVACRLRQEGLSRRRGRRAVGRCK